MGGRRRAFDSPSNRPVVFATVATHKVASARTGRPVHSAVRFDTVTAFPDHWGSAPRTVVPGTLHLNN
jgi:hypothetical protein